MRIAYVYYVLSENQAGIETKIRGQARAIKQAALDELELFVVSPTRKRTGTDANYIQLKTAIWGKAQLRQLFGRYELIRESMDLESFDVVILRYPLADRSGIDFTRRVPVITEHNTLEPLELESRLAMDESLVMQMARRLYLRLERRYAPAILANCLGLIAVTDEIRRFELERAELRPGSTTIANGVDVASVSFTRFKRFDSKRLDIAMVAGSLRPWHGLDRLIRSFQRYRGSIRWQIHVIGNIDAMDLNSHSFGLDNIVFHGPLQGERLDSVLSNMNIAASTLALHRKGMTEACPLKTREYVARGMPFIFAYEDPDLPAREGGQEFCLGFDNSDDLIEVERVIDFSSQLSERVEAVSTYMREYASKHMDWSVKMVKFADFARGTCRERRLS